MRTHRVEVFRSSNVSWKQGLVRLQRATWHSCMQWGWPAINAGERLARWADYWVLSFRWRRHGLAIYWTPHRSFMDHPASGEEGPQ